MTRYSDPRVRFSFDYPAGWNVSVGPHPDSAVVIRNPTPTKPGADPDTIGGPDRVKIDVTTGPAEDYASFGKRSGLRETTVDGRPADYIVYLKGDPELERYEDPDLRLAAAALVVVEGTAYEIVLFSSSDPPDAERDLFFKIVASFKIGS